MLKLQRVAGMMLLLPVLLLSACTTERIVERPVIVTHTVEVTRVVEVTRQVEVTQVVEVTRVVPVASSDASSVVGTEPTAAIATPTAQPLAQAIAAAGQSSSEPLPCWGWAQAAQHIGESGCVEGTVTGTGESPSVVFVNFSPERDSFYLVSFDWAWEELAGECLRAEGTISEYQGRPQLIINDPAQLSYCGSSDSPPAFQR